MVAQTQNGNGRLAALSDDDTQIFVVDGHRTRRRIGNGWPRLSLDLVRVTSRVVEIETKVRTYRAAVYFLVDEQAGHVTACAHPDDPGRRDLDAPGEFPNCIELQAEALALGML